MCRSSPAPSSPGTGGPVDDRLGRRLEQRPPRRDRPDEARVRRRRPASSPWREPRGRPSARRPGRRASSSARLRRAPRGTWPPAPLQRYHWKRYAMLLRPRPRAAQARQELPGGGGADHARTGRRDRTGGGCAAGASHGGHRHGRERDGDPGSTSPTSPPKDTAPAGAGSSSGVTNDAAPAGSRRIPPRVGTAPRPTPRLDGRLVHDAERPERESGAVLVRTDPKHV